MTLSDLEEGEVFPCNIRKRNKWRNKDGLTHKQVAALKRDQLKKEKEEKLAKKRGIVLPTGPKVIEKFMFGLPKHHLSGILCPYTITSVISPVEFYVKNDRLTYLTKKIEGRIAEYYTPLLESLEPLKMEEIVEDRACIFYDSDGECFRRAKIRDTVDAETIQLQFIDYGSVVELKLEHFNCLLPLYTPFEVPQHCLPLSIYGLTSDEFSEDQVQHFVQIIGQHGPNVHVEILGKAKINGKAVHRLRARLFSREDDTDLVKLFSDSLPKIHEHKAVKVTFNNYVEHLSAPIESSGVFFDKNADKPGSIKAAVSSGRGFSGGSTAVSSVAADNHLSQSVNDWLVNRTEEPNAADRLIGAIASAVALPPMPRY